MRQNGLRASWWTPPVALIVVLLLGAACNVDRVPLEPALSQQGRDVAMRLMIPSGSGLHEVARGTLTIPSAGELLQGRQTRVLLDSVPNSGRFAAVRASGGGVFPRLQELQVQQQGAAVVQPRPQGRRVDFQAPDGQPAHLIVSGGKERGRDRVNVAASLFVDGVLLAVQEIRYALRSDGSTRALGGRLTMFDSTGRASAVLETGPDGPPQVAGAIRFAPQDALRTVLEWLSPRPLFAGASSQSFPCSAQVAAVLLLATTEGTLAAAALATAAAACASSFGVACGAVVGAAVLVGAVSAALYIAIQELRSCWEQSGQQWFEGLGNTGGLGGGGGSNLGCITIHWYISYDDGLTWSFWFTEIRCGPINDQ